MPQRIRLIDLACNARGRGTPRLAAKMKLTTDGYEHKDPGKVQHEDGYATKIAVA